MAGRTALEAERLKLMVAVSPVAGKVPLVGDTFNHAEVLIRNQSKLPVPELLTVKADRFWLNGPPKGPVAENPPTGKTMGDT